MPRPNVPCPTCPWRKSSTVGGADIPNFDINLMRSLRCTVGDGSDDFRPIMACHYSACGGETPCAGYVAQEGYRNINVRLAAMRGDIDIAGVMDACEPLDLWESFEEMLTAYEEAACPGE
jgi:hypothetical protein